MAVVFGVTILITIGQIVSFWFNIIEFGDLFVRPIYYSLIAGFILSFIALFRLDFRNRRSVTWWSARVLLGFLRRDVESGRFEHVDFGKYKLGPTRFVMWQLTKLILGIFLFSNLFLGLSVVGMFAGWNPGLEKLWGIFFLPFTTPLEMSYAQNTVIPLIPALTLIIPPILGAIGIRLALLVGLTHVVKAASRAYAELLSKGQAKIPWATIQGLIALAILWSVFNLFFPSFIDFNTKYIITGAFAAGVLFTVFAVMDRRRGDSTLSKRAITLRLISIFLILLVTASVVAVNNSIADARKVEWRGPYTAQQIAVNRYLAELDDVRVVPYNFSLSPIPPSRIDDYIAENQAILSKIRLWDWQAAFAKLKPEIGLIPYVDFQDSDIIRFNGSLYWSASMKPVLPTTVRAEDRWYAGHLVYTHVPNGFLILDGYAGTIIDTELFFKQRRIYYGEGGLFQETWAAYPVGRETSDELEGFFYTGSGGISIQPPLSWVFEPSFLLSYPDRTIHALRYRDVYDRMQLLFPYFLYEFGGQRIDMLPVTDGENTYWLMPLMFGVEASNVPWSGGNPIIRLVGYALIDTFNGDIQLIITGDDFFSKLFKTVYSDYVTTEIPEWLGSQLRYPEELFNWRVYMFGFFHVTDPSTFIVAKEFYEVPRGLSPYYIIAQPPLLDKPEFIGLLSLELRGAAGKNLAGYMIVRNDEPNFGELIFYQVALDSPTKFLGPSAVLEALERNPDFATLRTLLRDPRIGDNILYRIGDYDVYFIPVYTAGAGGVVAELGAIAAVGATFTGEYYVGLGKGNSPEEAFRAFLVKLGGVEELPPKPEIGRDERIKRVESLIEDSGFQLVRPAKVAAPFTYIEGSANFMTEDDWEDIKALLNSFLEEWGTANNINRVIVWAEGDSINFGIAIVVDGIAELHHISINFG